MELQEASKSEDLKDDNEGDNSNLLVILVSECCQALQCRCLHGF